MWQWLAPQLESADAQALGVTLAKARGEVVAGTAPASGKASPANNAVDRGQTAKTDASSEPAASPEAAPRYYELTEPELPSSDPLARTLNLLGLLATSLALFTLGLWLGRRPT